MPPGHECLELTASHNRRHRAGRTLTHDGHTRFRSITHCLSMRLAADIAESSRLLDAPRNHNWHDRRTATTKQVHTMTTDKLGEFREDIVSGSAVENPTSSEAWS
jgi:hypothetical protein